MVFMTSYQKFKLLCVIQESSHYCNGPLKPGTEYRFKIRAYTEYTKFSETRWSKSIRTDPDNTAVLVGIIIPIILLILAVIVIFAIKRCVLELNLSLFKENETI